MEMFVVSPDSTEVVLHLCLYKGSKSNMLNLVRLLAS